MFINLKYNPNKKVYPKESIEQLKPYVSGHEIKKLSSLKWKDIMLKLSDGVYEYYDVNDPHFLEPYKFKVHEYVSPELAEELGYDTSFPSNDGKIFVSHPYGVCDDWKQIFERVDNIESYINSKEKFVIFLCAQRKKTSQKKVDGVGINGENILEIKSRNVSTFMTKRILIWYSLFM